MGYHETFARAKNIRIILSIARAGGLHMVQFDIKTAYRSSTIQELGRNIKHIRNIPSSLEFSDEVINHINMFNTFMKFRVSY